MLTLYRERSSFSPVQLTIEIPDELAQKAEAERDRLIGLVERTLRQPATGKMGVIQEVFEFLARRPSPQEILAFRPSPQAIERLAELLDKNREGVFAADEESETRYHAVTQSLVCAPQNPRPAIPAVSIPGALRLAVWQRAQGRCEVLPHPRAGVLGKRPNCLLI